MTRPSQNSPAYRTQTGQFAPGVSGNPSGRPKRDYDIAELARQHTEDAIRTLVEILQDTKASAGARISAANAILDRGYGKAPQSIDVGPTNDECFVQLWRMIGEGRLAKIDL
jgi:hypothetical protein